MLSTLQLSGGRSSCLRSCLGEQPGLYQKVRAWRFGMWHLHLGSGGVICVVLMYSCPFRVAPTSLLTFNINFFNKHYVVLEFVLAVGNAWLALLILDSKLEYWRISS